MIVFRTGLAGLDLRQDAQSFVAVFEFRLLQNSG